MKNVAVQIHDQTEIKPYLQGRNGPSKLTAVELASYEACEGNVVDINGINSRGVIVNGGFRNIPVAVMDELATKWLEARGFTVQQEPDHDAKISRDEMEADQNAAEAEETAGQDETRNP